jgi:hypothetical protein
MIHPRSSYAAYEAEVEAENQREKDMLRKFYERNEKLTKSQTVARRLLVGLAVLLTLAAVMVLRYWPK